MKLDGIVISCYALDVQLTRVCVASIRFWYPDIPIWLLKDRHYGDFSTTEIEKHWDVRVYPGRQKTLGWGFGKLEVITEFPERRFFIIDSDIVFAGRVIERLESFAEDLIVNRDDFDAAGIQEQFFELDGLRHLDQSFEFPGYGFNTGQVVVTTGRIPRKDFDGLLDWRRRVVMHPDIFKKGEQGLANYIALRKAQRGELTIRREPFMAWPGVASLTGHIHVQDFTPEGRHQQVIHWAGLRWGKTLAEMPRPEILLHFEHAYYRRIFLGGWLRQWRDVRFKMQRACIDPLKRLAKRHRSRTMPPQPGSEGQNPADHALLPG